MAFFKDMERIIKLLHNNALEVVEHYYFIDFRLLRPIKDIHTDVYGVDAGNNTDFVKNIRGIVVGDDFAPTDAIHAGTFEEGFFYTTEKDIRVADLLDTISVDGRSRTYKVISHDAIGMQDAVFTRYRITNLGD